MKHTLRCHDLGLVTGSTGKLLELPLCQGTSFGQNRASPQGVAARIAASIVARLANTASIGCTSLRAIDDPASQRTRVSSCYGLSRKNRLRITVQERDLRERARTRGSPEQ